MLFLDEPTTGLDPRSRNEVWDMITELVRGGTTVLLTTQYLEEADQLADNIVVIDHGKAIAEGTSDELKAQVGGERIEIVVASAADVGSGAGGAQADRRRRGRGRPADRARLTAPVSGGAALLMEALRRFDAEHIKLSDVALRRPTLDDVFLPLTGHASEEADRRRSEGGSDDATKAITDGLIVTKRNLIKIKRVPDLLVFSTISPIMFILLFAYVFGSQINVPGTNYREYLIPGIFAQTVIFVSTTTGAGLADDMQKGIIDRFRSLPMSRSAVLIGRTGSDVVNNVLVIVIMSLTGLRGRLAHPRRRCSTRSAASCCCCCSPTRSRGSWPSSG